MHSSSRIYVLRLKPHEDLRKSILHFAAKNQITAGVILTCVGSLEQAHLRFANQSEGSKRNGHFEIVSLVGTFSDTASHLHLALADEKGNMFGGHVLEENLVYTTAEIALAELNEFTFDRLEDPAYGYAELVVKRKTDIA